MVDIRVAINQIAAAQHFNRKEAFPEKEIGKNPFFPFNATGSLKIIQECRREYDSRDRHLESIPISLMCSIKRYGISMTMPFPV